jgi:fumarate hydratase class II
MTMRTEHDALGDVQVPDAQLWGAQTQRSIENFPIGRRNYVWGRDVIRGFGILKKACALANQALGQLPAEKVSLIVAAAEEVIAGTLDGEFPLVVFQTGSGTQSNMNANEVIANRAIQMAGGVLGSKKPINPNDDVNRGQSSNDTFPAVMHIAAVEVLVHQLIPAVEVLALTFREKALKYADVVMTGRTHLQDATPITLGQVFSGWEAQLNAAVGNIKMTLPGLCELERAPEFRADGGGVRSVGDRAAVHHRAQQVCRVIRA